MFPGGEKYEGRFKDGHFHGQGTHTLPNGSISVGEFRDDEPRDITEYNKEGTIIGKIVKGVERK